MTTTCPFCMKAVVVREPMLRHKLSGRLAELRAEAHDRARRAVEQIGCGCTAWDSAPSCDIVLSSAAFDAVLDMIETPPAPSSRLVRLLQETRP